MVVAGIGLYFIVLRPPLLPEDIRFIGLTAAELATIGPRLAMWLSHVFRVLGGYALATGILAVTLAATAFRSRHPVAVAGAMVAGASSIGLMSVVNFTIGSDFKWALLACALVWALSLVAYGFESCASVARCLGPTIPFIHPSKEPNS
jgi:FtsH-binding integral membrane protein